MARSTRLTTTCIIGNDQTVLIKHRALKARIRTHVFTDLLTHPTRIAIRRKGVEQDPEPFPRAQRQRRDFIRQHRNRSEVTDKRKTCP